MRTALNDVYPLAVVEGGILVKNMLREKSNPTHVASETSAVIHCGKGRSVREICRNNKAGPPRRQSLLRDFCFYV